MNYGLIIFYTEKIFGRKSMNVVCMSFFEIVIAEVWLKEAVRFGACHGLNVNFLVWLMFAVVYKGRIQLIYHEKPRVCVSRIFGQKFWGFSESFHENFYFQVNVHYGSCQIPTNSMYWVTITSHNNLIK